MIGLVLNRGRAVGIVLVGLICLANASFGAAADTASVRTGSHADLGRIVVDAAPGTTFKMDQTGEHVVVHFADPTILGRPPSPPRNVVSLQTNGATADFVVVPGAVVHPTMISGSIVFDILDPPAAAGAPTVHPAPRGGAEKRTRPSKPIAQSTLTPSPEPGGRAASPPAPEPDSLKLKPMGTSSCCSEGRPTPKADATSDDRAPASASPGAKPAAVTQPVPTAPQPDGAAVPQTVVAQPLPTPQGVAAGPAKDASLEATQPPSPGRDLLPENTGPVGLLAVRTKLPKGLEGAAFVVPFGNTTGAALFQHGGATYVVFDERRPVDMAALHDDRIFGQAAVQLLPSGTLLRLPVPDGVSVALSQTPQGWRIAGLTTMPKSQPIIATFADGSVSLSAEQSSQIISMADPDSGATLLVGTQRHAGQGVAATRRTPEFVLYPTGLGVVVEPLSDAIMLKVVPSGFSLTGGAGGLAASPSTDATEALMQAAHLTRRLIFSTMPTEPLMQLKTKQITNAAMALPQAKGPKRQAVAQSMMALGMAAEAESLLHVAAEQDPRLAALPDVTALTAIAALLAGRLADADGINDPRLSGTDDVALWRGIRQAMQDQGSPAAAAVFASTAPLALLYPKPIADQILPLMIETMIQGGQVAPAAQLLNQRKTDSRLDYARALQLQADGKTDQALASLDEMATGHDRLDRARAASRAVELRLSTNKMTVPQAADALDKLLYAWRGDQRELALRERIAELRGQAGQWRLALSTLRQAEADFPEQGGAVHDRLKDAFASMVAGQGLEQMTPIEVVSAIDENADLMPTNGGNPALEEQLADRLLALDLPERARPALQKLMKSATSVAGKARFGATLAALESREKDDSGALVALDASDGHDLPAELVEKRALLRADAIAHRGDTAGAAALLVALGTPAANEARGTILEQAQDWAGAERAWSDYAASALPQAGSLDDGQVRTLLRLATAAARSGDDIMLATLREKYDSRVTAGPLADMFRLLAAEPVRGTSDLKRAKQEVSLAQSLPAGLKALAGTPPMR